MDVFGYLLASLKDPFCSVERVSEGRAGWGPVLLCGLQAGWGPLECYMYSWMGTRWRAS